MKTDFSSVRRYNALWDGRMLLYVLYLCSVGLEKDCARVSALIPILGFDDSFCVLLLVMTYICASISVACLTVLWTSCSDTSLCEWICLLGFFFFYERERRMWVCHCGVALKGT